MELNLLAGGFFKKMARKKKLSEKELAKAFVYKGYDMRWLKSVRDEHPDGGLVDKFEKKYGEIK